jgi:hypothetical protein
MVKNLKLSGKKIAIPMTPLRPTLICTCGLHVTAALTNASLAYDDVYVCECPCGKTWSVVRQEADET